MSYETAAEELHALRAEVARLTRERDEAHAVVAGFASAMTAERERVKRLRRWIRTREAYDSHEGVFQWESHAEARAALQPGDLDKESD